jgi:hypothetical protein
MAVEQRLVTLAAFRGLGGLVAGHAIGRVAMRADDVASLCAHELILWCAISADRVRRALTDIKWGRGLVWRI